MPAYGSCTHSRCGACATTPGNASAAAGSAHINALASLIGTTSAPTACTAATIASCIAGRLSGITAIFERSATLFSLTIFSDSASALFECYFYLG